MEVLHVVIPYTLVKETVKELTDQINMEMEAEDPCPGIGVPADKTYPWYVELRNLFQKQLDKRSEDYDFGFKFAQYMYQRYLDGFLFSRDIICPTNVSAAFEEGFSDCLSQAMITEVFLGSRESCEDKDAWDDFNKAISEEED